MSPGILQILKRDFKEDFIPALENKIEELYSVNWNVGHEQLIRSLLCLVKGSPEKFFSFFPISDPRDIVMEVQMNQQDQKDYF